MKRDLSRCGFSTNIDQPHSDDFVMLPHAFQGHGVFCYLPRAILSRFGNDTARMIAEFRRLGMLHAWVRLHDHDMKPEDTTATDVIVAALTAARIAVAGWGFVRGENPNAEAKEAARQTKARGLMHYVADIEQDEHDSVWTPAKVPVFLQRLRTELASGASICVSSYPYIVGKHPELMRAAASHTDVFNPQLYWHDHPQPYMLERDRLPPMPSRAYGPADKHDPAAYADLCLDWWRATVGAKPLLASGQAYWDKPTFGQSAAEQKLPQFLSSFTGWPRLVGFNWWHFATERNTKAIGAMTTAMSNAVAGARLDAKPFRAA